MIARLTGDDSIFVGGRLLTTPNPEQDEDARLFALLDLRSMEPTAALQSLIHAFGWTYDVGPPQTIMPWPVAIRSGSSSRWRGEDPRRWPASRPDDVRLPRR